MKHILFRVLRSIFIFAAMATASLTCHAAHRFANENLTYTVSFKWGLIHKEAGTAVLSLKNNGSFYDIRLAAKSKPWADRIYSVRDTLISRIAVDGFKPKSYRRIAHEGGKFSHDEIHYSYSGHVTTGDVTRTREKDGNRSTTTLKLSTPGAAYDLLSVFYYLRTIDFASIPKGKVVVTTLFSGKEKETVKIRPVGPEKVSVAGKRKVDAYHIRFNFTSKGKKKSSDDIDAWISTDGRGIPLMVVGKLPVGQIRCVYTGK